MIKIPIEIGDTVYVGRFKNKKIIVKSITYNEYGLPMINGRPLLTLRIEKLMPTKQKNETMKISEFRKLIREEIRKVINENNANTPKLKSLIQKKTVKEGLFGDVIKGLKKLVTGDKMKFLSNPNNDKNSIYGYYQDDDGKKWIGVRRFDLRQEPGYKKSWVEIYDLKDEEIIKKSEKNAAAKNKQFADSREDAFSGGGGDASFTAFKGDYFPKPIKVINNETF